MESIFQSHSDQLTFQVELHTSVEPQELNIQTPRLDHAHGICNHLQMITTGLLLVATIVILTLNAQAQNVVSHLTQDTLILSKRLAVTTSDTGLLIKFVELFQASVHHSIAKLDFQHLTVDTTTGTCISVLVLAHAINQTPQTSVAVVLTGMKRVSMFQNSQILRNV